MSRTLLQLLFLIIALTTILIVLKSGPEGPKTPSAFDARRFEVEFSPLLPRLQSSVVHLLAAFDPERDCALCLFEMEHWSEPMWRYPDYGISFLIPSGTDTEITGAILEAHGLPEETIIFIDENSPLSELYADGVLKIVYSHLENKVLWHERGNKSREAWDAFSQRLENTLKNSGLKEHWTELSPKHRFPKKPD